jgi:hypothetical protein
MKKIIILFFIFLLFGSSQEINETELKKLYTKTIHAIKANDSLAFLRLWEYPDSLYDWCGNSPENTFHNIAIFEHFKKIRISWMPFIKKLKLIDAMIDNAEKEDVEDWGQPVCFLLTYKGLPYTIYSEVRYHKNKLVYDQEYLLPEKLTPN